MKAVVADNRGLRLVDLPLPVMPSPEWALVRVACGGICGSDLRRRPSTLDSAGTPVGGGVVVGHEMVGVVECAPRSGSVAVGDRVLVDPRVPCAARGLPSCDACSKGIPNYCRRHWSLEVVDGKAIGFTTGLGGGWAEYVAAHSSMLLRLPDEMAWENAVLAEPLAVAISGLQRVRALAPQRVIIVGGGTLGQLAAAAAEALLPGVEVLLLCRHPFQASAADRVGAASGLSMPDDVGGAFRALAERLGARLVDGPSGPMLLDGPDLVIEAAGTDQALTIALRAAGEEGTVLTLGNTDSCSDLRPLWLKGLRLVGHLELSMGQPKELGEEDRVLDEALMLLRRRPHVHTELVTHAFALPAFRDALAAARERRGSRALKVVLMP